MRTFISYYEAQQMIERMRGTQHWEINDQNLQTVSLSRFPIDYRLTFHESSVELSSSNRIA